MCLAVPMQVESIEGAVATCPFAGGEYRVRIDLVDVDVGDYVLVHAGIAVATVNEEEALETLKEIDDINRSLSQSRDGGQPGDGDPA